MIVEPQHPIGAIVRDVELADRIDHESLRHHLAEHGVLVFPNQALGDDAFSAFLRGFGELAFTSGETPVQGRTDLNLVTNVGRDRAPVSNWHVDTAYISAPPSYTSLRAVEIPEHGGDTLFSNQYRAWETLDADLVDLVADRTMTHVVTGVDPSDDSEVSADHPIARPHPRTGRISLLLDAPSRCAAVSGLDDTAAAELAARLLERSTRPDNVWRHRWRADDVVIWDNAVVLHRADHSDVSGNRTFHRGMVVASGYQPS